MSLTTSIASEIRVYARPALPHDPLTFKAMDDYDLNLCLYRTWFDYDESRNPMPGVIAKWTFDSSSGAYTFEIAKPAMWSDGSKITSKQMIQNIQRAIKQKSTFGETIRKIIEVDSMAEVDQDRFKIVMVNRKPSKEFFTRMGSAFLAITHPNDWDANGNVIANKLTNGPYSVEAHSGDDLVLKRNEFDFLAPKDAASKIIFRLKNVDYEVKEFLEGKVWPNIHRENSIVSPEMLSLFKKNETPYWTRGVDRVSLLRPLIGKGLEKRKSEILILGKLWNENLPTDLSMDSKPARSLQPLGYPLFEEIDYSKGDVSELKGQTLKIVTNKNAVNRFIMNKLDALALKVDFKIEWEVIASISDFVKVFEKSEIYDFSLFSFGVADPDPATWLALVFSEEMGMVYKSDAQFKKYKEILKHADKALAVKELRDLTTEVGVEGGYLPLIHYSSLVLGQKGMSFAAIDPLDETVNYAKVTFH